MAFDKVLNIFLKNKIVSKYITPESIGQLTRYLATGFSSAAIELALLYVLKDHVQLNVVAANSIALTIVFWFNFLVNRFWSFKSKGNIGKQLIMYGILFAFNLTMSDIIMYALTSLLYLQYLIAKVFAIGAVVCWNFIIYKKVIYK